MSKLKVERQGHLAVLTLQSPPVNVLDLELMEELRAAVVKLTREARPDDKPRAILLASGVPGQFSQGLDPRAILTTDVEGRRNVFRALCDLAEALWLGYVPVIADISGPALAGGAVLATMADFAIIDGEKGKICFSEVKVGLPLPKFVQRVITSKVSPSASREVMLLGRNVDAADAHRLGFANAVYKTPEERKDALHAIVSKLTRLPPSALSQTLREMRSGDRELFDDFRGNMTAFADFLTDDYLVKGLKAVVRGESPKF
jgi:enoyl-CoA hydratase/carnithine racemase